MMNEDRGPNLVVFESWTHKKSKHFKTLRKRWCVLKRTRDRTEAILETYEADSDSVPTEKILLNNTSVVIIKRDPKKFRLYPNGLKGDHRSFECDNDSGCRAWVAAVGKAVTGMRTSMNDPTLVEEYMRQNPQPNVPDTINEEEEETKNPNEDIKLMKQISEPGLDAAETAPIPKSKSDNKPPRAKPKMMHTKSNPSLRKGRPKPPPAKSNSNVEVFESGLRPRVVKMTADSKLNRPPPPSTKTAGRPPGETNNSSLHRPRLKNSQSELAPTKINQPPTRPVIKSSGPPRGKRKPPPAGKRPPPPRPPPKK